jgi:hypothetical protein
MRCIYYAQGISLHIDSQVAQWLRSLFSDFSFPVLLMLRGHFGHVGDITKPLPFSLWDFICAL